MVRKALKLEGGVTGLGTGYRQGSGLPFQSIIMALLHLDVGKAQDPHHAPVPHSGVPFGGLRPNISRDSLRVSAH